MAFLFLAQTSNGSDAAGIFSSLIGFACFLVFFVIYVIAHWRIFEKAGKPGWASIIPIYNIVVMLEIIGRPLWWIVLFFIPGVNFLAGLIVYYDLARSFGFDFMYTLGLFFLYPIFILHLAFSDAQYRGPVAAQPGY